MTESLSGFLPVQKPPGLSSFSVIRQFQRHTGFTGKVGHGGTLDVFASGVLVLLLGKATRAFDESQKWEKYYRAGVRLGMSSSTLDIEGELLPMQPAVLDSTLDVSPAQWPEKSSIVEVLPQFLGTFAQRVPQYSAAKQHGQPLYKLARQGKPIMEKTKEVTVTDIQLIGYVPPLVTLDVRCGSGTYIRQLTADIFQTLTLESFLFLLERRAVGPFLLEQACPWEKISAGSPEWQNFVQPLSTVS